jgi:hypothetical protein
MVMRVYPPDREVEVDLCVQLDSGTAGAEMCEFACHHFVVMREVQLRRVGN